MTDHVYHVIVEVLYELLALLVGELPVPVHVVLSEEHLNLHVGKVAPDG